MIQPFPRDGYGVVDDPFRSRLRTRPQSPAQEGVGLPRPDAIEERHGFTGGQAFNRVRLCHGIHEGLKELKTVVYLTISEKTREGRSEERNAPRETL